MLTYKGIIYVNVRIYSRYVRSHRYSRVEFSTKFSVIQTETRTVLISFYHSMAIFFCILPPHPFFSFFPYCPRLFALPQQRESAMLKFIVEIRSLRRDKTADHEFF